MELISQRLRIRNLPLDDLEYLIELEHDPDVLRFANSPELISSLQTSQALKNIILSYRVTKFGIWAIENLETSEFIGTIATLSLLNNKNVEVGFRIRKELRGQGFATEALDAVSNYFSSNFGITKFVGTVHPENSASKKVLIKLGFCYVGEVGQGFGKTGEHETVCWFELNKLVVPKTSVLL